MTRGGFSNKQEGLFLLIINTMLKIISTKVKEYNDYNQSVTTR